MFGLNITQRVFDRTRLAIPCAATPQNQADSLKKGDVVHDLKIERLAFPGGQGVTRLPSGIVGLVEPGPHQTALPGAVVAARVKSVGKKSVELVAVDQVTPHTGQVTPPCQSAAHCNGCALQALQYESQLQLKQV